MTTLRRNWRRGGADYKPVAANYRNNRLRRLPLASTALILDALPRPPNDAIDNGNDNRRLFSLGAMIPMLRNSLASWRPFLAPCVALLASLLFQLPTCRSQEKEQAKASESAAEASPATTIASPPPPPTREQLLDEFSQVLDKIESEYVQPVDRRRLAEAALRAMLRELDPHSDYVAPGELARFEHGVQNEFEGVGLQLTVGRDGLTVLAPIPHSPAFEAGLAAGDRLLAIQGKSTDGMSLDQAIQRLAGPSGEAVEVTVLRAGDEQAESLLLQRKWVRQPTVIGVHGDWSAEGGLWCDATKRIGYVRLASFGRRTAGEFREAVTRLLTANARGLILDLRGNPGGFMDAAIDVADLFIAEGTLVSASGRHSPYQEWEAHEIGTVRNLPLCVLVDRDSASASEIVAACLQDHQRAVIVGECTYGKGTVQSIFELQGGQSALKLTTARYLRPNGEEIQRQDDEASPAAGGVQPDYVVEFSQEERAQLAELFLKQTSGEANASVQFVDRQVLKAIEWLDANPPAEPDPMTIVEPVTANQAPAEQSRLVRSDMGGASS